MSANDFRNIIKTDAQTLISIYDDIRLLEKELESKTSSLRKTIENRKQDMKIVQNKISTIVCDWNKKNPDIPFTVIQIGDYELQVVSPPTKTKVPTKKYIEEAMNHFMTEDDRNKIKEFALDAAKKNRDAKGETLPRIVIKKKNENR